MDNLALAGRVIDRVTEHPEQFDMDDYGHLEPDGPVACLAGWTLILAGYTLYFVPDLSTTGAIPAPGGDWVYFRPGDYLTPVEDIAAEAYELLGLRHFDFFRQDNDNVALFGSQSNDVALKRFRELADASR